MELVVDNVPFASLFEPLDLGFTQIKNRLVMGSIYTGLEENSSNLQRLAQFYSQRAQAEVGLIITGGFAPDRAGRMRLSSAKLTQISECRSHLEVTKAVHDAGSKILLQILHAGRYGEHPFIVAPSKIRSPITNYTPWEMSANRIYKTINHYVRCANLAQTAGYDGIEIMGGLGYLINQFLVKATNKRHDEWGGTLRNRMRFPLEIIRQIRAAVGENFIICMRISTLDLINNGGSWSDVEKFAKACVNAGVNLLNISIGWQESKVPILTGEVPHAAFATIGKKIKDSVTVPVLTGIRINTPEIANQIITNGCGDMVVMTRPYLADPEFAKKTKLGEDFAINTCIACNQACVRKFYYNKTSSCTVNPRACHETKLVYTATSNQKWIAVVGGGMAGLAYAAVAAERGHKVTLFEKQNLLGGQFNLAKKIPGKEEYQKSIDYYTYQLNKFEVEVFLQIEPSLATLQEFDEVVIATGVKPRIPDIPGINSKMVIDYSELLQGTRKAKQKVAILGAGGIGFDVAKWLTKTNINYYKKWGVDLSLSSPGGISEKCHFIPKRQVYLLSEKKEYSLSNLEALKSISLKNEQIQTMFAVKYQKIDADGLHIKVNGITNILDVDTIVLCTGQTSVQSYYSDLKAAGCNVSLIGGAFSPLEHDVTHAINQASRLAAL